MGFLYFKEAISLKWVLGSLFIISGVSVIASSNKESKKDLKKE